MNTTREHVTVDPWADWEALLSQIPPDVRSEFETRARELGQRPAAVLHCLARLFSLMPTDMQRRLLAAFGR